MELRAISLNHQFIFNRYERRKGGEQKEEKKTNI
jgi:hypothetical protein